MVEKAFTTLDKDKSGQITFSDVANLYDVSKSKDFISGKKSREEIVTDFLNGFDGASGNNDGIITRKEFFDYYTDLAMSTPSDEYFVKMMESVWMVAENSEDSVFTDKVKYLVGLMRQRLISLANGQQEEYYLRKIFREYD
jgi:Ca2+-binding EF-hand superfamily protein